MSSRESARAAAAQEAYQRTKQNLEMAGEMVVEAQDIGDITAAMDLQEEARKAHVRALERFLKILESERELPTQVLGMAYEGAMQAAADSVSQAVQSGDVEAIHQAADQMADVQERFDSDDRLLPEDDEDNVKALLKQEKVPAGDTDRWLHRARYYVVHGVQADRLVNALLPEIRAAKPARIAPAPWTGWEARSK